jgi:predicted AlkP superfamily pyrophosphatase or phosphodiesterase
MHRNYVRWLLLACQCAATSVIAAPVLLISVDGLHPDYMLEADRHNLEIPHLRSFVTAGAYASGVIGVVPTITYPSHTTMLTGVAPAEHGIVSNTPFDPLSSNQEGWYWYAEDIRVPTLWSVLASTNRMSAAINWPVTVADRDIDVLVPEYWRARNMEDLKLLRALSRPEGVLEGLEARLGPFIEGYTDTVESDRIRARFALAILREHKPYFTAVHLIALDGTQHRDGPFVASAYATLEAIDAMIGELSTAALANDPRTVVAVVSDHGFIATHTAVNLRTRFVAAGLIRLEPAAGADASAKVASWDAQVWPAGGSAAIMLRDGADRGLRSHVAALLAELAADADNGIARVLPAEELKLSGGFPDADFLIEFAPGFYADSAHRGDFLTAATSKGTHGYLPGRPEMHAAFFVQGAGIAAGRALGVIDMRQIAPTLARVLEVALPGTAQPELPIGVSEHGHGD